MQSDKPPMPYVREGKAAPLPANEWHGFRTEMNLIQTGSSYGPRHYALEARVHCDPRIAVLGVRSLVVDEIEGKAVPRVGKEDAYLRRIGLEIRVCRDFTFEPGTKFSSVKAHLLALVGAGTATLEIPDIVNLATKRDGMRNPLQIGENKIDIMRACMMAS